MQESLKFFSEGGEGPLLAEKAIGCLTSNMVRGEGSLYEICHKVNKALRALKQEADDALKYQDAASWTPGRQGRRGNSLNLPLALRKLLAPLKQLQEALEEGESLMNRDCSAARLEHERAKLRGEVRGQVTVGDEFWDDWEEKQFRGNRFVSELSR